MSEEKLLVDIIRSIYSAKKSGGLYISTVEASEDLFKIFFKHGEIDHIQYGTAHGNECLEIVEFYTLNSATFFENVRVPELVPSIPLPPTRVVIAMLARLDKKVRLT
jgi:hypothetical protein